MVTFVANPLMLHGLNTQARKTKFLTALKEIEVAVNSAELKEWFLQQKFRQLGELAHLTNEELYYRLLKRVDFNYSVLSRSWWKRWSTVIGYTLDNLKTKGPDIFTYGDSYDGFSIPGLAGHIFHELLHALGFSHSYEWNKDRDYSLPYAVGYKVEAMIREARKNK